VILLAVVTLERLAQASRAQIYFSGSAHHGLLEFCPDPENGLIPSAVAWPRRSFMRRLGGIPLRDV